MRDEKILEELLRLFIRQETPPGVRAAIAQEFGESRYYPAKEALLEGLTSSDAVIRDACIESLAIRWKLDELGPRLIEILEGDEYDFVRMRAAEGLGAIRYKEALPILKRIILESAHDQALQETAYEAVLSILGKEEDKIIEAGIDKPIVIDWELVHSL